MTSSQFSTTPTFADAPHGGPQSRDFIGSTSVIPELIQGFSGTPPTYEKVKQAIYSGRIPAVKVGGRWLVRFAHIGVVADLFGMAPKAASSDRANPAAAEHAAA